MRRLPPRSTRTDTLLPSATFLRSGRAVGQLPAGCQITVALALDDADAEISFVHFQEQPAALGNRLHAEHLLGECLPSRRIGRLDDDVRERLDFQHGGVYR